MDLQMIAHLAQLSKLSFTPEEMERMASDMTDIIGIMDTVKEIDIAYEPIKDNHNVFLNGLREDISAASIPTEKVLQNAVSSQNCFVVPKVFE